MRLVSRQNDLQYLNIWAQVKLAKVHADFLSFLNISTMTSLLNISTHIFYFIKEGAIFIPCKKNRLKEGQV